MARPDQLPVLTAFSRDFAAALREVMERRGVTQTQVAEAIGRTQGYVSERVRGVRAPDTDVIAGVAQAAGVQPSTIASEVVATMRGGRVPLDSGGDPSL